MNPSAPVTSAVLFILSFGCNKVTLLRAYDGDGLTFNEAHGRQFRGLIIVGPTIRADHIPPLGLSYVVGSDNSGCASHSP